MKIRELKISDAMDRTLGDLAAETGLPLHAETANQASGKQ